MADTLNVYDKALASQPPENAAENLALLNEVADVLRVHDLCREIRNSENKVRHHRPAPVA